LRNRWAETFILDEKDRKGIGKREEKGGRRVRCPLRLYLHNNFGAATGSL